jgi:hypothetical protein
MLPTVSEERQVEHNSLDELEKATVFNASVLSIDDVNTNVVRQRNDLIPSIVNTSTLCNVNELFRGVVFGRSVRMSFCSIHVARIQAIDETYHSPQRVSTYIPMKETCEDDIRKYNENDTNSSEGSAESEESHKAVALIRIQFMVDNPTELRSYCRRFVKNGDLLSIVIPPVSDGGNTSSAVLWQESSTPNVSENINDETISPLTIWQAPRLVVNVDSVEHAIELIQIERRNFWSMRQYQEWQRVYLQSTPTIAMKKVVPTAVENDVKLTAEGTMSDHGSGLKKRAQGEFVASFLLHLIAKKVLHVEDTVKNNPFTTDPSKWANQNLREIISPQDFQKVIGILNAGSGVYDVAGGSGHVSMALGLLGVSSTVVDPREKAGKLPKRDRKMFQKSLKRKLPTELNESIDDSVTGTSHESTSDTTFSSALYCQPVAVQFETLRAWFGMPPDGVDTSYRHPDQTTISVLSDDRIRSCSAIVALHPDEATDAIVDTAVRFRIPFVIVPCCVFNRLFQHRRMPNRPDIPVSTHQDLLEYLQHKDASIQRATLPFEGSNTILWSHF